MESPARNDVRQQRQQLDLVELMLAGATSKEEQVEGNVQNIQNWFHDLQENLQIRQQHPLQTTVCGKPRFVPQLFLILRECLLTHRLTDVSGCLEALLKHPVSCRHTVNYVGCALLQSGYENDEILQQLVNQVKLLRYIDDRKVVLEFVLYLLAQGNTQQGKDFLQALRRRTGGRHPDSGGRHSQQTRTLYKAYTGLLLYVEWLLNSQKVEEMRQEKENHSESQGYFREPIDGEQLLNAEASLETQRTSALASLSSLQNEEGLWDIFIKKCVELHESNGELDKAEEVLKDYAGKNPENPQALLYIYEYYVSHRRPLSLQLAALERYCDAIPSDPLVLTLYDKLISQGAGADQTLVLLFDLLDYFCWSVHVPLWQRFSDRLVEIVCSDDTTDHSVVDSCWEERVAWWPQYHFDELRVSQDGDVEGLLKVKCNVAAIFLSKGSLYLTTAVSQFLGHEEYKSLTKISKKAREVGIQQI